MKVVLTNADGQTMCGTDGILNVDGRYCMERVWEVVRDYRERYKKNFPHKFEFWTHFGVVRSFRENPTKLIRI